MLQTRTKLKILYNSVTIFSCGDSNLSNLFRLSISNRDCYDLRSTNNTLMLPKPNTNAMKRTFGYRGCHVMELKS